MYRVEQYGGMTLVASVPEERDLQRALQRIHPQLFLDPEFDPVQGRPFWTVKYSLGDQPPLLILDWRWPGGEPKELAWGLVEEMRRRDIVGPVSMEAIYRQNQELEKKNQALSQREYEEIATDMVPRILHPRRTVQPRSQSLRRMRDRQRSRGENV